MILALLISFFSDRVPTIVVPLYTRCPVACPMIVAGLKRALAESSARPGTYRVVLFSFDPRDTPADLRQFRQRHHLPADWIVASAKEPAIHELMDFIGFRYAQTGGGFTHPNMIAIVTPDLKLAGVLNGTEYRAADIDRMLAGRNWLDRYTGPVVALLLFACMASVAVMAMPRARTRNQPADC